jgi:hypothetical protein
MLPRNQRMELLSRAYFQAVVAQAGGSLAVPMSDCGIDYSIHCVRDGIDEGAVCHVQLKSTTLATYRSAEDCFDYDLARKAFDFLSVSNVKVPRFLVLYVMPDDESLWLFQDHEGLILRHCAYYVSFTGLPSSANKRTIRVQVPRSQVFSAEHLQQRFEER